MPSPVPNPLAKNPESQGNLWVEVTIPLLLFTASIVGLRIWWRRKMTGMTKSSDVVILISLFCATMQEILGCIAILKWGLGHHAAYIGLHKTQKALQYFYLYQIFYKILVGTTKISFVLLYLDLFPIRTFKIVCYTINASIVAAIIAFDAGTIFQCTPIPYFWNKTIHGGHCIGTAQFWYGHAAWNTSMDLIILILPIPVIRSLQMGRNQKFAVGGVFGLGAFVIVASVMRMIALDPASKTTQADMTYVISTSNAFLWTQVESSVAIICACLPTLKGPLAKMMPGLFGSKSRSNFSGSYKLENYRSGSRVTASEKDAYARRADKINTDDASSQERIIGITKEVDIQVSVTRNDGGQNTRDEEIFRGGDVI